MAHVRDRAVLPLLIKHLKHSRVVGLVGPRQSGKSTVLRDLLCPKIQGRYLTLDSLTTRERAERTPEAFVEPSQEERGPLVIDEIQKVPDLFDAIKVFVDENPRPGQYIVSGSTEFSRLTGIRESLTGRISLIRMLPLTLSERFQKSLGSYFLKPRSQIKAAISPQEWAVSMDRGGMPGFCFVRNPSHFETAVNLWIETTCFRDIQSNQAKNLNGNLAQRILTAVAQATDPTCAEVAHALNRDSRVVQRFLDAFCRIFVLERLDPHQLGIGKPHYLLCDPGIARVLGAPEETILRTHVLNEARAAYEYTGLPKPLLQYYRNSKKSRIPLLLSWPAKKHSVAIQIAPGEAPSRGHMDSLRFFMKKDVPGMFRYLLLSQARESGKEGKIEVYPLRA